MMLRFDFDKMDLILQENRLILLKEINDSSLLYKKPLAQLIPKVIRLFKFHYFLLENKDLLNETQSYFQITLTCTIDSLVKILLIPSKPKLPELSFVYSEIPNLTIKLGSNNAFHAITIDNPLNATLLNDFFTKQVARLFESVGVLNVPHFTWHRKFIESYLTADIHHEQYNAT